MCRYRFLSPATTKNERSRRSSSALRRKSRVVRPIVVINDGSVGRHAPHVRRISRPPGLIHPSELQLIHFENNRGKRRGRLRAGIEAASQDYFLIQDADLERMDPSDYPALILPISEKTRRCCIWRPFSNLDFQKDLRIPSRIANTIVTGLSNVFFGLHLKDQACCGYKLLPASLAPKIEIPLYEGFEICSGDDGQAGTPARAALPMSRFDMYREVRSMEKRYDGSMDLSPSTRL